MKTILAFFSLIILTVSCQLKQNDTPNEDVIDDFDNQTDTCVIDTVKATAIFWIDKAEKKDATMYPVRTVKAKVLIHEDGKVDLKEFVKEQSPGVNKYIRHYLDKFQVPKRIFEGGYLKPGEQFIQIRCLWGDKQRKIMQD